MDPLLLARIQFGANITFHILFPTITVALAWVLLYFRLRFNRSGEARWMDAYRLWVKVFALSFAFGVVSGITMSFQFGTNWPGYMETVGNIAGPLLAYEVLTAFFLEAAFLGIMLFGYQRVSKRVHTGATALVALGTSASAFWILVLNAWMHTPAGFEMIDGVAHARDWWAIIFNPSMPYRLGHMLLASALTVAFLLAGVSALRWLRGGRGADIRVALRTGVLMAALFAPLQILLGDLHGLNTAQHQPAKVAAIEGVWQTQRGAPLLLFAVPDETARENRHALGIPGLASLILTHDLDGEVLGLDDFPDAHPPVAPVFFAFRIMVGVGLAMLVLAWLGAWQLWRHGQPGRWTLRALVAMTASGWLATVAGWYVTEIGRQPWLVQGVLRTAEAAATLPGSMVATSLGAYLLLYAVLLASYVGVLLRLAGAADAPPPAGPDAGPTPARDEGPVAPGRWPAAALGEGQVR